MEINFNQKWLEVVCCSCGIQFFVPQCLVTLRKQDHKAVTCPNGHIQYFTEPEALQLQSIIAQLKQLASKGVNIGELEPVAAFLKIIYQPNDVTPEELDKLLGILTNYKETIEKKEKENA